MDDQEITIDLREIFLILKKYIWLIVAITLVAGVGAFVFTKLFIAEKFQASATMIVNTRQDQNISVTYDQINSAKQLVSTYAVILKSDTVLDEVIENLNLSSIKGWEEINAQKLAEYISISPVQNTQIIEITAETVDAELSTKIVGEIVKIAPDIIIKTVKAGSVEMISQPKAKLEKVSPHVGKISLISAFVGCALMIGIILLFTIMDNRIKTDEDITKHFNLPVLGIIPEIE